MPVTFLKCRTKGKPITLPVSVIDSTFSFKYVSGVWFFKNVHVSRLVESLQLVLDSAPYLGGSINFVKCRPFAGSPYKRFLHTEVAYNYESDPGVLIEIDEDSYSAESLQTLLEDTKTGIERVEKPLDIESFIYEKARNIKECAPFQKGSPTLVKITKLADGTVAIGLATSHVFTDATGFYLIMSLWSKAYRGQEFNAPVYDPREVDNACQAKEPTRILGDVRPKLYDLFTSKELLPGPSGSIIRAIGRLFRWAEPFELNIDKTSLIFNFTPDQIESIYQSVAADCSSKISHMDALLGYFWTCITKSRNLQGDKPIN